MRTNLKNYFFFLALQELHTGEYVEKDAIFDTPLFEKGMDVQNRHQVVKVGNISFVLRHAEDSHQNLKKQLATKLTYIADSGTPSIVQDRFVKDLVYLLHLQILPNQLGTVSSGIYLGFA